MSHDPVGGDMLANGRSRPLVAVLNTSEETVEMLCAVLEDEGYRTTSAHIVQLKRGEIDAAAFFAAHRPQVIIYDLAIPYQENWQYLHQQIIPISGLAARNFVLTSTNTRVLAELTGAVGVIEIVGKPYDLDIVLQAVARALNV